MICYWAGSQLAMMIVNPDLSTKKVLKFYYDAEGRPLCLDFIGTVYLYITNLQGDVVALADQYGEVIRYEYDAWGKPISTYYVASPYYDAMRYNPLRYRGYIYDNETGFYYLQSRYYDPVVGRFINADTYASTGTGPLGYNMFAYCNNNPVTGYDPTGESMTVALGIILAAAVVCAVANGVKAYIDATNSLKDDDPTNDEDVFVETIKSAGKGFAVGLLIGGAIVCTGGVFAGVAGGASAPVFGIIAKEAFALGALAIDAVAWVIAPLYGIEMEGIEYEGLDASYTTPKHQPEFAS